jgi:hypothetical protein
MAAYNNTGGILCDLTFTQVAAILTERGYPMTAKIAWHLERQALQKIASHPLIRCLAEELELPVSDVEKTH